MFQMGAATQQFHTDVRKGRAGQYALVRFFEHMRLYQPLPVQGQRIHMTERFKTNAAALGTRRQAEMYFCIVPQRLIVTNADAGRGDGFHIEHAHGSKLNGEAIAVCHQLLENLQLNLPHHVQVDAAGGLAVHDG